MMIHNKNNNDNQGVFLELLVADKNYSGHIPKLSRTLTSINLLYEFNINIMTSICYAGQQI